MEREAIGHGQTATRPAVVLAEGEEGDVRLEEVERVLLLVVKLDLELHRVGLDVDEPAGLGVLGARFRAAVEVEDQLGRGVEAAQLALAHPVEAAVDVQRLVGPASSEAEPRQGVVDEGSGERPAVVVLLAHQHAGRSRVRLDVVRVEPEPLEADEVVDRLPDDSCHRDLGHHPEQDDLAAPVAHALPSSAVRNRCSISFAGGRRVRVWAS